MSKSVPIGRRPRADGAVCTVEGCDRPKRSTSGLCDRHRARVAKGLPLVQPYDDGSVGERRSGYGLWGVVTRTEDGVLCHECGRWLRGIGSHLVRAHSMSNQEYRDKHGLAYDEPLSSLSTTRQRSENGREQMARDPDAAARFAAAGAEARARASAAAAAKGRGIGGRARISSAKTKPARNTTEPPPRP